MPETSFSRQMILKLGNSGSSTGDQARANQPKNWFKLFFFSLIFWISGIWGTIQKSYLKRKKMISMPLMMEKPVRRPMVPQIRLSLSLDLLVSLYVVKSDRVKEDLNQL